MSDNFIVLIPEDPRYVPAAASQERAHKKFLEIAPEAEDVNAQATEVIRFFHCVENFCRALCPSCGSEIPLAWWQDRMEEDYDDGFKLARYPTPCCGAAYTLNNLLYEGPQGFGRFDLSARNPNIEPLDEKDKQELEAILGTRLRVLYVRI